MYIEQYLEHERILISECGCLGSYTMIPHFHMRALLLDCAMFNGLSSWPVLHSVMTATYANNEHVNDSIRWQ